MGIETVLGAVGAYGALKGGGDKLHQPLQLIQHHRRVMTIYITELKA